MKTLRIGKEYYRFDDTDPGRESQLMADRAKASKIPTAKQFQAHVRAHKDKRDYPLHLEGMSTKRYVEAYFAMNASKLAGFCGTFNAERGRELAADFFESLSTNPQFSFRQPLGELA